VVLVDGRAEAISLANAVAPEHLELLVEGAEALLPLVRSAGAVFCGRWSPASMGDYLAGPNHVLPTARTARFSSALRVDDFRTHIHAVSVERDAIRRLAPYVATIAEAEGLPAHALSVQLRAADAPDDLGGTGETGGGPGADDLIDDRGVANDGVER
jgi:histidinol dehydrogenase